METDGPLNESTADFDGKLEDPNKGEMDKENLVNENTERDDVILGVGMEREDVDVGVEREDVDVGVERENVDAEREDVDVGVEILEIASQPEVADDVNIEVENPVEHLQCLEEEVEAVAVDGEAAAVAEREVEAKEILQEEDDEREAGKESEPQETLI